MVTAWSSQTCPRSLGHTDLPVPVCREMAALESLMADFEHERRNKQKPPPSLMSFLKPAHSMSQDVGLGAGTRQRNSQIQPQTRCTLPIQAWVTVVFAKITQSFAHTFGND